MNLGIFFLAFSLILIFSFAPRQKKPILFIKVGLIKYQNSFLYSYYRVYIVDVHIYIKHSAVVFPTPQEHGKIYSRVSSPHLDSNAPGPSHWFSARSDTHSLSLVCVVGAYLQVSRAEPEVCPMHVGATARGVLFCFFLPFV